MVATNNISTSDGDSLVLVGTMKGAFILRAPAGRSSWELGGPYLPGHSVFALAYDGRNGRNRIWAAASSMHWGAVLCSSDDFGATWTVPETATVRFPENSNDSLKQIWQIQLGGRDEPDTLYCGVEPAALFKSTDAGSIRIDAGNNLHNRISFGSCRRREPDRNQRYPSNRRRCTGRALESTDSFARQGANRAGQSSATRKHIRQWPECEAWVRSDDAAL